MWYKRISILLLLFISVSFHTKSKDQDSLKNNKLSFGLYFDEILCRKIDLANSEPYDLALKNRILDVKGSREFYDSKWYHFNPLIVYKHKYFIHQFGFRYTNYSPKETGRKNGEYYTSLYFSGIGLFYRLQKIFMLKSNNENQVYTSLGIKLDGALMKAKQEYFNRPYENNYESLDIASVESKSLTLALSPSLHLKEEKAIFELGLNINLLTWIDYNGDVYHYYNLSNGKQIIESDNKINFKEIVTPKNTLRSRTMFFSVFLIYNFRVFKK